ncbi:MAG TPA: ABC transporter permease [Blastocatellia bacterium]|nr:ABC transporter permease [Blastocatellia bacterium]
METLFQDIRFGLRRLAKSPGFTVIALLSLALGIGANTAIFSLVNAVLLRPLPFHDPDRLVMVWEEASFAGFPRNTPAPANYADWKAQNQVFEDMAALTWRTYNLTGDGEPEKVSAYAVTANFFPLLGVQPALGRTFLPEEDKPDAGKVAVLSYGLWQSRYGGEPGIIGRDILLNGEKHTVIGVMPAGFQFLESYIGLWVPAAFSQEELANRGSHYLTVVARMKPGVTLPQAQSDMEAIMQRIGRDFPNNTFAGKLGAVVLPLHEQLAGEVRRPLMVLLVAVGLVLLIACANIANLLLARAASRRKEIAVRTALGAGRTRIMRQLLTESVLLAGAGGLAGMLFASWSFAFLQSMIPADMVLSTSLKIDDRVLGYTLLISLLTGIIFGLAPAFQASKVDLNEALKQGGGRAISAADGNKLRGALVVTEIALALVLLVGAGLLMQTFFRLRQQYSGLRPEGVLTLRTQLPRNKYREHPRRVAFYDQVLERVKALPGVISAGYSTSVPLEWKGGTSGFVVEGRQLEQMLAQGLSYDANHRQVSADYLKTMGIPLRQGRYFDETDNAQSMPVAIINETMARQYWPDENPIGKRFKIGGPDEDIPWLTVVGVVGDVRQMGLDVPVKAEMYVPYQQGAQHPWYAPRDLVLRAAGDPKSLVAAVRSAVRAVDPEQPVSNIRTMDEILGEEAGPRRMGVILLAAFAGLALLLASLGIYGVLAYFVAQHTPEIGVRLALGASPRDILGLVLRRGMRLTLLGVSIGLAASFALTRLMASLLYGVSATDPATFAAVALLLAGVALLACYLPARRATKVDPMVALRYE